MSRSTLSGTQRLLNYLKSGRDITARQAQTRFGLSNIPARISEIRQAGYAVYLNEKETRNGETIKAYRLGTPTREMVAVANRVRGDPYLRTITRQVSPSIARF